jgi:hypothetical protein
VWWTAAATQTGTNRPTTLLQSQAALLNREHSFYCSYSFDTAALRLNSCDPLPPLSSSWSNKLCMDDVPWKLPKLFYFQIPICKMESQILLLKKGDSIGISNTNWYFKYKLVLADWYFEHQLVLRIPLHARG